LRTAEILPPRFRSHSKANYQSQVGKRIDPERATSLFAFSKHANLIATEIWSHAIDREDPYAWLMMCVIHRAMEDLGRVKWPSKDRHHDTHEGLNAAEFISSPDFAAVTEPLGLDPAWVRGVIRRWTEYEGVNVQWGVTIIRAPIRVAPPPTPASVYKLNRRKCGPHKISA
jgi:hypothetical protein